MTASTRLIEHARARDALLQRIVAVLRDDPRIVAAWPQGSFAAGTADEWSDLDLHVVVRDEEFERVVAQRMDRYRQVGEPSLAQQIIQQRTSFFVLLLYPGGIEVDWSLWSLKVARRPALSRLLFDTIGVPVEPLLPIPPDERATCALRWLELFWAMAAVGFKNAGRGHTHWAADSLDLMNQAFDDLWRLVNRPDGPDPSTLAVRHRPREPELKARIPPLPATIDPPTVLDSILSLCAEMERLHPEIAALGVELPAAAPTEIAVLADLATAMIAARR
ncbi:MAG: nucleotidyltransferase domain-containing protein [Vicinamibacterales bacterium]